jgi:hypothetical protein
LADDASVSLDLAGHARNLRFIDPAAKRGDGNRSAMAGFAEANARYD